MFAMNRCAQLLACVAALGMATSPVLGAIPTEIANKSKATVFDVKLSDGHLLGQVLKSTGKPDGGANVVLVAKTAAVGKVKADNHGRFALPVEKTGVYRVVVADRTFTIRAWQPAIAPPSAKTGLLCVTQDAVRGQCGTCNSAGPCGCEPVTACGPPSGLCGLGGGGGVRGLLSNPVVIGLGVAAAIAIPIAVDDDDDDDDSGSGAGGAGEPSS